MIYQEKAREGVTATKEREVLLLPGVIMCHLGTLGVFVNVHRGGERGREKGVNRD